jgi:hypothetical protein
MEQDNLTSKQLDYAVFLPAISSFYSTYVGRQRHEPYIDATRMPAGIPDMEMMNWLNPQKGLFPYRWSLYSAGHADLDVTTFNPKEDMTRNRDPNSILLGDSGGFQIAKGVWEGEWKNPNSPEVQDRLAQLRLIGKETRTNNKGKTVEVDVVKEYQNKINAAQKRRETVLKWLDGTSNYAMTLDIPTWTPQVPGASAATGIYTYDDAVNATHFNNEYFIKNRKGHENGGTRFLNVLQGSNHVEADKWYELMKQYCDPAKYDQHFNGWAMGGQNMCDVSLALRRIVTIIHDGLLQPGKHDWMHFLGTSKLEWACLLTDIQRAVRKYHNPQFTISFDCASPFLATANGQIYTHTVTPHRDKWSYKMSPTVDDKKYATDGRLFRDAVLQDGIHDNFDDSPISARLKVSDVCVYKPGDLNKIGKEGATSWDSFSYALMMGHNVWQHINAVQEGNRQYDAGVIPNMLAGQKDAKHNFRNIVEEIFGKSTKEESLEVIDHYSRVFDLIIGTRGFTGKKMTSARPVFNMLFEVSDEEADTEAEFDTDLLDKLEESV